MNNQKSYHKPSVGTLKAPVFYGNILLAMFVFLTMGLQDTASAANGTWTNASGGLWSNAANWAGGIVPGSTSVSSTVNAEIATFNTFGATAVTLDAYDNLGTINFALGVGSFTLSGGTLGLSNAGTIQLLASVTSTGQTETIAAPITQYGATYNFINSSNSVLNDVLNVTGTITNVVNDTITLNGINTRSNTIANIQQAAGTTVDLVKQGNGSWYINGSTASTGTGNVSVFNGLLGLDFSNMGGGSNLLSSSANLVLGWDYNKPVTSTAANNSSATFQIAGVTGQVVSQTVQTLSLNPYANVVIRLLPGSTGTTNLTITGTSWYGAYGTLYNNLSTPSNGLSLLFDLSSTAGGVATVTTAGVSQNTNGIIPFALVADTTGTGFATVSGGEIVRYNDASTGNGGSGTLLTAAATGSTLNISTDLTSYTSGTFNWTVLGGPSVNSLSIDTTSNNGVINLGAPSTNYNQNVLKLTSGAILFRGGMNETITGGQILDPWLGNANQGFSWLSVHQLGSGTLSINSPIGGFFSGLTKDGSGELDLGGVNTYLGNTIINAGTLKMGAGGKISSYIVQIAGSGMFDLNGQNQTIGMLSVYNPSLNAVTNSSGTAATLTLNNGINGIGGFSGNLSIIFKGQHNGIITLDTSVYNNTGDLVFDLQTNCNLNLNGTVNPIGRIINNGNDMYSNGVANKLIITAPIGSSVTQIQQNGQSILELEGNNSSFGGSVSGTTILITGGKIYTNGSIGDNIWGAAPTTVAPTYFVINSGTLQTNNINYSATINSKRGIALGSTAGSGTGTIDIAGSARSLAYNGIISNNGGGIGSLNIIDVGTLKLGGSNTYTGSTIVNQGNLFLDFNGNATLSPTNNIINNVSTLVLAGGSLTLNGKSSANNSQTFNGLNLLAGESEIGFISNGASSLSGTLGTITRNIGSTLNITGLAASGSSTTLWASNSNPPNTILVDGNGTAYATVGGTTWATINNGQILGMTPGQYAIGTNNYTSTNNVIALNNDSVSNVTVNSLGFTTGTALLTLSGTNIIATGGILAASGAVATISSGTITSGNTTNEMVLLNFGTLNVNTVITGTGSLTIDSDLAANTTTLGAVNTYSGSTQLEGLGTIKIAQNNALNTTGFLTVQGGVTFDLNGFNQTVAGLSDGGVPINTVIKNSPGTTATLTINETGTSTFGGIISGTNLNVVKSGVGTLTLMNFNSFTGVLTVNGGILATIGDTQGYGAYGLGSGTSLILDSGTLDFICAIDNSSGSLTVKTDRIITLNSGGGAIKVDGSASIVNISQNYSGVSLLTGVGSLTKTGDGNLMLDTPLTYSGNTILNQGGLYLKNNLPTSGTFFINGGSVENYFNGNLTLTPAATVINGSFSVNNVYRNSLYIVSPITLNTLNPIITVNDNGSIGNSNGVSGQQTQSLILSGSITDNGHGYGFTKNGNGILSLSGTGSSFTGNVYVTQGILTVGDGLALTGTSTILQQNVVDVSSDGSIAAWIKNAMTLGGLSSNSGPGGAVGYLGNGNYTLTLNVTGTYGFSGSIKNSLQGGTGSNSLVKNGLGTQILSGSNTYTGVTTINGGTLDFGMKSSLYGGNSASWTATNLVLASGATLAFRVGGTGSGYFTESDVSNLVALGGGSAIFKANSILGLDTTAGDFTYHNAIVDPAGQGPIGLTKLGSNILTVSGTSTYTGATKISQGTLNVTGSLVNTTGITINGDSNTMLAGIGSITAPVTFTSGGIAPGDVATSNPGTLNLTQILSIPTNQKLDFMLSSNAAGTNSLLTGLSITLNGNQTFTFHELNGLHSLDTLSYTLIHASTLSTDLGTLINNNYTGATVWFGNTQDTYTAQFTDDTAGNLTVQFTYVPEPQAWMMFVGGMGMLAMMRRRK